MSTLWVLFSTRKGILWIQHFITEMSSHRGKFIPIAFRHYELVFQGLYVIRIMLSYKSCSIAVSRKFIVFLFLNILISYSLISALAQSMLYFNTKYYLLSYLTLFGDLLYSANKVQLLFSF